MQQALQHTIQHATPLITTLVGALVLAFVLGMAAHRLRFSPLAGYLAAGVIAGPFTPGFVADLSLAPQLAELGVILLMFGVGLHFSLKDLLAVKGIAIPGAIVQISCATLLGIGLSALLGWSMVTGLVFGLCLSTASTVVLLRALEQRQLLATPRGQIAIGWLIVEDVTMVLVLVLLPAFSDILQHKHISHSNLLLELTITLAKVLLFIALMIGIGRRMVPWILAKSASTGSRELFTLAVLALALGLAYGAVQIFNVSFALGAFFAGVVLNESELSHRAASDTLPLRDAFAVLFFVSVGMLLDPIVLWHHPFALLGTLLVIMLGKSLAAYGLVRLFGHSRRTALTISVSLAQIGEFSFILSGLGLTLGIFNPQEHGLILAAAILSIMLNPIMFNLLEDYLKKHEALLFIELQEQQQEEPGMPGNVTNHALLIGYDGVGERIAEEFRQTGTPVVVITHSRATFDLLRKQAVHAVLGNPAYLDVLTQAQIANARWLILFTPNGYEAAKIIYLARHQNPYLRIIARARFEDEREYMLQHGADQVIIGDKEIADAILEYLYIRPQLSDV